MCSNVEVNTCLISTNKSHFYPHFQMDSGVAHKHTPVYISFCVRYKPPAPPQKKQQTECSDFLSV